MSAAHEAPRMDLMSGAGRGGRGGSLVVAAATARLRRAPAAACNGLGWEGGREGGREGGTEGEQQRRLELGAGERRGVLMHVPKKSGRLVVLVALQGGLCICACHAWS